MREGNEVSARSASGSEPGLRVRFAITRQLDRLLGGKVSMAMPSGRPIHSARLYNRRAERGMVFMPGECRRSLRR